MHAVFLRKLCLRPNCAGSPLGGVGRTLMLRHSSGINVGVVGLVEGDWVSTLSTIEPEDVRCVSWLVGWLAGWFVLMIVAHSVGHSTNCMRTQGSAVLWRGW